jgi:hypothetical protein
MPCREDLLDPHHSLLLLAFTPQVLSFLPLFSIFLLLSFLSLFAARQLLFKSFDAQSFFVVLHLALFR